jgi:ribosomal protein S18 acetylase RimI-like enzyme
MTLVAELSGEIVGFIDAQLEQSLDLMHRDMIYCHIAEIAVSYRHQSQGIGGRLLRAAEDWGRRQGAEFASLEYHAANIRAGSFYQHRMGYRLASITAIKRLLSSPKHSSAKRKWHYRARYVPQASTVLR